MSKPRAHAVEEVRADFLATLKHLATRIAFYLLLPPVGLLVLLGWILYGLGTLCLEASKWLITKPFALLWRLDK